MGYRVVSGLMTALACLLWSSPLIAQEKSDLPVVETLLSCGKDCKSATDPKPDNEHTTKYPGVVLTGFVMDDRMRNGPMPDALVLLRATVTKDGILKDPKVVRLIGASKFAEAALESVKDWRYQPATRGGVPVDRPNWEIKVPFVSHISDAISNSDIALFGQASALSAEGKHTDAIAKLLPVLSKLDLTFYERETVSLQLAIDYAQQGDLLSAREYLDDIALIGDRYLAKEQRPNFWRMLALINAKTGQLVEAKQAFSVLNAIQPVAADDPLAKLAQAADQKMHNDKLLTATGRIAKASGLPSWSHYLMRHNFTFVKVSGKLDRLSIWCGERLLESAFSDKAEWHIPKDWSLCRLDVYGDPGATFTLAEMDDSPS
ncbi:energy transducer TonB [Rhizomicrobium electricum]|jgi:TonB family protein|uniref:TonB C-terminal domain-containing protein n=1 Tax=Rhizomicrobium electricum TaxID=480070 RepID=A0ABN1F928_9PROT|nr:energy transducer TonB [Rhizomicrobium electricum]NIJ46839.1 TonB family protein [Rhizomicrobium electricum]